jgi:anti-sigma B factor antagonist
MDDIRISLDTAGPLDELNIVRVDGVVDTMTATELEAVMKSLLDQKKYRFIIDLAGVDYISSAGWGIFIGNIREIRAHDGDLKLARMIPSVYEIFELLEFDSILKAYDSIEKAKADFKIPGINPAAKVEPAPIGGDAAAPLPQNGHAEVTTEEYRPQIDSAASRHVTVDASNPTATAPRTLEQEVLGLIKADPFYSIGELVKLINGGSNGSHGHVGWWRIWNILRHRALLSKKNRFRYSRRG